LAVLPAVAVVFFLVVGAGAARADDAAKARELFTQGNTFFDLGQFDKAIAAWQQGYQLKNDPGFLYNIGQAYRTMGDAEKAIFFYKRYLINAPKAKNKAEVEQKIEILQKQLEERHAPPTGLAPSPSEGGAVEPPPPSTTTPPPGSTPPPLTTSPAAVPAVPAPGVGSTEPPTFAPVPTPPGETPPVAAGPARRIDLGASLGFDTWSSGTRSHASPSFAFALDGGYTFGNPAARVRFRMGLLFGYTFLKETTGTDNFFMFLLDPTLVVRVAQKVRVSADLGLGSVSITGLTPTSTLLVVPQDGKKLVVNGSGVARGVVRLGVMGEYELSPGLSVFVWPALDSSPKTGNFYAALTRVEVLFGAAYRF
jgi:hypothetical protein